MFLVRILLRVHHAFVTAQHIMSICPVICDVTFDHWLRKYLFTYFLKCCRSAFSMIDSCHYLFSLINTYEGCQVPGSSTMSKTSSPSFLRQHSRGDRCTNYTLKCKVGYGTCHYRVLSRMFCKYREERQ